MPTYLVRWPNGLLSIATADDMKDLPRSWRKMRCARSASASRGVGQPARADHRAAEGLPPALRASTTKLICEFRRFPSERGRRSQRLFPHLAAVMKVPTRPRRPAMAAAKEAMEKERQGLKALTMARKVPRTRPAHDDQREVIAHARTCPLCAFDL